MVSPRGLHKVSTFKASAKGGITVGLQQAGAAVLLMSFIFVSLSQIEIS